MFHNTNILIFNLPSVLILNLYMNRLRQQNLHGLTEAKFAKAKGIYFVNELLIKTILVLQMNVEKQLLEFLFCF